ncbi:TetR/AcrR family tetracycline transcriptional repressor [Kutzneria viridogrisea]|uniref:TetR/AcrR family tetracycline transcriptional repressor n=1 Tax=Kutzneria viridogrisea TaxID=47990 RepID=A0ABR6BX28_9PSEU|nr:TetR family transcriptional regulator [Kutzneria albida]MBA8931442.1 TetR/AcrR family tetracycline transcriptional repressor [Kutzneria viridogrisea]
MSRRDEVLQAALDLLDEVGLDALTTRRLAERLGVRPGALYRHFDSKRALLEAMVQHLLTSAPETQVAGDWAQQVRAVAGAGRAAMLTRRDGARLLVSHLAPSEAARAGWERFVGVLRGAGLDEPGALLAADTVFSYVNGFTIEEQTRDGFPQTAERRAWRDQVFQAGLELIVAGIRTSLS